MYTFKPQNRDTNMFLDLISELKANQKFQIELGKQISNQSKIVKVLSLPIIALYFGLIIAPVYCFQKILERKTSLSKAKQHCEVLKKQEKIYHKNVLSLENDLEGTLEICNENFEIMLKMTKDLTAIDSKDNKYEDAHVLIAKFNAEPPENKLDRLQLFLTLESTWLRIRG